MQVNLKLVEVIVRKPQRGRWLLWPLEFVDHRSGQFGRGGCQIFQQHQRPKPWPVVLSPAVIYVYIYIDLEA